MHWWQFKSDTEGAWRRQDEEPEAGLVYGGVTRRGTCWNPGMAVEEIDAFEAQLGFVLPLPYREMLRVINGFDRPEIFYYKEDWCDDEAELQSEDRLGFHTYPRDWESPQVREMREIVEGDRQGVAEAVSAIGLNPYDIVGLIPLYMHRVLVAFKDPTLSPVISHHPSDVIIYGKTLRQYMLHEFNQSYDRFDERLIRRGQADARALGKLERARGGRAGAKREFRFLFDMEYLEEARNLKLLVQRCGYGEAVVSRTGTEAFRVNVTIAMAADPQSMTLISGLMVSLARECYGVKYRGWEGGEPVAR